jgi:hypothetical protein
MPSPTNFRLTSLSPKKTTIYEFNTDEKASESPMNRTFDWREIILIIKSSSFTHLSTNTHPTSSRRLCTDPCSSKSIRRDIQATPRCIAASFCLLPSRTTSSLRRMMHLYQRRGCSRLSGRRLRLLIHRRWLLLSKPKDSNRLLCAQLAPRVWKGVASHRVAPNR